MQLGQCPERQTPEQDRWRVGCDDNAAHREQRHCQCEPNRPLGHHLAEQDMREPPERKEADEGGQYGAEPDSERVVSGNKPPGGDHPCGHGRMIDIRHGGH